MNKGNAKDKVKQERVNQKKACNPGKLPCMSIRQNTLVMTQTRENMTRVGALKCNISQLMCA